MLACGLGGSTGSTSGDDQAGQPGQPGTPVPFWQAPALPTAVIQGGAIPPGWQPQPVPYQGVGPDGQPVTMYFAPTYVFTYQVGPPVPAQPAIDRPQASSRPQAPSPGGWNYATSGVVPATMALPAGGYTQHRPVYQFPPNSQALTGTPLVPPGPLAPAAPQAWSAAAVQQQPPPPQPAWPSPPAPPSTGPAAPVYGPPPNQWVPAQGDSAAVAAPLAGPPPTAAIPSPAMTPVVVPPLAPVSSSPPAGRAGSSHLWRVVGVYDGDTITCLDEANQQQKVRLAEIDAPESGQDYGKVSREALAGMVFGRTVQVVDQGRDRSGRWVAHVSVDGIDVNRQMVAGGNAWHYTTYSNDPSLAEAQRQAQAQRLGLWSQQEPMPPWEYRASGQ